MEKEKQNFSSGDNPMTGQSNNTNLVKNFFYQNFNDLDLEIVDAEDSFKPQMFNIWIEARKKITKDEAIVLMNKLKSSYFCAHDEVSQFIYDFENFNKIKIAVLPKIYTSNFIRDLKSVLNDNPNIFINLNEHPC